MRAVVQRVTRAEVRAEGRVTGSIDSGLWVLLAVGPGDSAATAHHLAERIATLRVFGDAADRMNLDIGASEGSVLVVSQFTLFADSSRGHRPSFVGAAPAALAAELCDVFVEALRERGLPVATGAFGAHMEVEVVADGPVTIVLSSDEPPWEADAG
jgi:D-tyrosyl-tRNA(Tyr) deacylase